MLVFCALLLFVLGTNYQNNPIIMLSFLIFALLLGSMYSCFFNLIHSDISFNSITPVYLGDDIQLVLLINCPQVRHQWNFDMAEQLQQQLSSVMPDSRYIFSISTDRRGCYPIPRLKLSSSFPFGFFTCWSYLRFPEPFWVFPKPSSGDWWQSDAQHYAEPETEIASQRQGDDNFEGIQPYQLGESRARISWKHVAKHPQHELVQKSFSQYSADTLRLTLQATSGRGLEEKVSILVEACLRLESEQRKYGLDLYGFNGKSTSIDADCGDLHLQSCLKALAVYGL